MTENNIKSTLFFALVNYAAIQENASAGGPPLGDCATFRLFSAAYTTLLTRGYARVFFQRSLRISCHGLALFRARNLWP